MLKVPESRDELHIFSSLSEFRELRLEQDLEKHILAVRGEILNLQNSISEDLRAGGAIDGDSSIDMGSELEFYAIAGEESYDKRLNQLQEARKKEKEEGGNFEQILGKDDSFMPETAQREQLDKAFDTLQKFDVGPRRSRRCEVHSEPSYNAQHVHEREYGDTEPDQAKIAIQQYEAVVPPLSPPGFAMVQVVLGQRIIDQAPRFGLERAEIRTKIYDMSCSSFHVHISLRGKREGVDVNLMERDSFPEERGNKKRDPAAPSQLALEIAFAMNEFLRDHCFLFAPTEEAHIRFRDAQYVGTSFIGFSPRRERFNMGSAMFRGAGRKTYRVGDPNGKPDSGPLRIEVRLSDVAALGHPNKRSNPEQLAAPFELAEAFLQMIRRGVASWGENRKIAALDARSLRPRTEAALYEQHFALPENRAESLYRLQQAVKKEGGSYLTPKRLQKIIDRADRQKTLNYLELKPNLPRGQNVDRTAAIKLHEHNFRRDS